MAKSAIEHKKIQDTMLRQLKNPFEPRLVKWRVGATSGDKTKGIALPYIDSREVTRRLDEVCGAGNWQNRLTAINGGFICEIMIKVGGEWVSHSDAAGNTQVEPIKGGASDAFKRAAAKWGIGRYLYYLPNSWVSLKPAGKSYLLAEIPELPDWALPDRVERWEDVAEREVAHDSGEDAEVQADDITAMIARAHNIVELKQIADSLAPAERRTHNKAMTKRMADLKSGQWS